MRRRAPLAVAVLAAALGASPPAAAVTNTQIPGLQVALRAHGLYDGPIDGVAGPATARAVRAFQRRAGITVDGIAGLQTRTALGRLGRPLFGRRALRRGKVGWDVSVLQFLLEQKGVLDCEIDGRFGAMTDTALRTFQKRTGLAADGIAGPATLRALGATGALAPPQPASPPTLWHVVRAGEHLTGIAARYGLSLGTFAKANRIDPRRVLVIGTRLRVPAMRPRASARAEEASPAIEIKSSLDHWARHYGVESSLVRAVAWMESGYQNDVVSPAGAFGVMQVTPATWDFVEVVLLGRKVERTADGNVRIGVAFLRHLLRRFGGDERLALAGYFQGPETVQRGAVLASTRAYVADVLALKSRV
jgi:peptidoglycan hydrolase-like protein with peptidoglycan-binding domain